MKIQVAKNRITTDITSGIKLTFDSNTDVLEVISIANGVLKTKQMLAPVTVTDFVDEVNNYRKILGVKEG